MLDHNRLLVNECSEQRQVKAVNPLHHPSHVDILISKLPLILKRTPRVTRDRN